MNRHYVVRLNDPRLRWPRRLFVAASIALSLFTLTGFFVMPLFLRHVAESQLSERLGRQVTIEKVRVNPFALSVTVEGFQMLEADGLTPFVTFRRLYVNCELASIYRRAPVLREVRLESPRVWVVRRQATLDAWAARDAYNFSDIVTRLIGASVLREPTPAKESPPPQFSINNIEIIDGAAVLDDRPLGIRHEIRALSLGVPFISTLPINVDTFVQPRLSLLIDGTPFGIQGRTKPFQDSLQTIVELRLSELDLTRYVSYVPLPLAFTVTSARLTVALDVSFVRPRSGAPMLSVRGQVALRDVALRETGASGRPLVGLDELAVTISAADLPARRLVLEDVLISGLDVHARRLADGSLDLEHLSPLRQPVAPSASRAAGRAMTPAPRLAVDQPARLSIREIRVEKTALHLRDESVRPPFEETIDHVTASIRRLSTAPGAEATEEVSLRASPGVTLKQKGTLTVDPLAAAGTFTIDGIEPALLAAYYRDSITFDVAKGRLRAGTNYRIQDRGDHISVRLHDAFIEVADLALRWRGRKGEIARIPELAVRGMELDLDGHAISAAQVQSRDGSLRLLRDDKGLLDLMAMIVPAAPAGPDWTLALARLDVQGWDVRYEDRAVDPPVVLGARRVSLQASNFSTARGAAASVELGLALPNKGRLAMAGSLSLRPVTANFRVDLRALDIVPLQKYWKDQVSFVVTRGMVSVKGQARVELPEASPGRSAPEPSFSLAGDIDVADFASVDAAKKEDLLRWQLLHVGGLKLSTGPLALRIRQVALSDFDARLVIFPDAHFNLEEILAGPARSHSVPAAASAPPPKIAVAEVTFQRGQVVFTDRKIQPRTSATLTELGGRLTGLSSDAATQADVEIRGALDHTGLLRITGRINPLARDLFVDMKAEVKDLDLPPASPYSAKYIGYGIRKGKLSLALDYHIASRKLDATNHVVLDQLTFGDKVQSPDAVNWPVKLAAALLKDRHGVIDVDLPIAGSLDDPDFKVGRLIWKALGNLVVKAATAPFSLIAKAFGGGDELSYLVFAPGLATLDAKASEKLQTLAKALQARPGLSFEIQGGSDPERDREGLRRDRFQRKLEAQKLAELVRDGLAVSAAGVRFDPTERPRLLARAYKAETFPKPRNVLGFAKNLAPEEMERLILANIRVENDDLRALALRRASAVKEALARLAPAETARLFLVNPRMGSGATRVDFKLKVD